MMKKIVPIVLSLCLMFGISVAAENTADRANTDTPAVSQDMSNMGVPPEMQSGEPPQGGNRGGQIPESGFTPPQNIETNNAESTTLQTDGNTEEVAQPPENSGENNQESGENTPFDGQMPGNMGDFNFPGGMANNAQNTETEQATGFIGFLKTYSTPIISVILLLCAFIFVYFYKRKQY